MINTNFNQVRIQVNYNNSNEELLSKLGINGNIKQLIQHPPNWNILPETHIIQTPRSRLSRDIIFFEHEGGKTMQVLRHMYTMHLRPVIYAEFVALIEHGIPIAEKIICLGTMWGKIGHESVLSWQSTLGSLSSIGDSWGKTVRFPAVYYSGPTNPLPGIIGRNK